MTTKLLFANVSEIDQKVQATVEVNGETKVFTGTPGDACAALQADLVSDGMPELRAYEVNGQNTDVVLLFVGGTNMTVKIDAEDEATAHLVEPWKAAMMEILGIAKVA